MTPVRLGAVGYLNARPLVWGLDEQTDRFDLRFEVPSRCASLLHQGAIDVGLIPSIEYLARPDYRVVPGIAITSKGPVSSVALFTDKPLSSIRSIAVDSSSRTSVGLLQILCARRFEIGPRFVTQAPDLAMMLKHCDAALLIGDIALFLDPEAAGVDKIDLGEEWTAMTGKPFVWAFWAGRPDVLDEASLAALRVARDKGTAASDEIARDYSEGDEEKVERGSRYLRENIQYALGDDEIAGARTYFEMARGLGLVSGDSALTFY